MSLIDRNKMLYPHADGATLEEKLYALGRGLDHVTSFAISCGCPEGDLEIAAKLIKLIPSLFDVTAHGEAGRREWLKKAIENHFQGLPTPEYKAK